MSSNAVIYARFSSHNQRDESIEDQIKDCQRYAEDHDLNIVRVYSDYAMSGRSDDRPNFQRMIRDASSGQFDYVIVYKPDRFARNRFDAAKYKYKLKQNNVRLVYSKISIPDSPEGIILESMLEGFAEYYSANLSQDVLRGMIGNAEKCKANGVPVFGYDITEEGYYVVNQTERAIVIEIFERYRNGESKASILRWLNGIGVRTSFGSPVKHYFINRVLSDERYLGTYKFADVVIEGGMPAMVSEELFEAVSKKLKINKRTPVKTWDFSDYILTGKLFCGHCHGPMMGRSGRNNQDVKYNYYVCRNQSNKKTCDKKPVRKQYLEDYVVSEIYNMLNSPAVIDEIASAVLDYQVQNQDRTILASLEKKLAELYKKKENLLVAIEDGFYTPDIRDRMESLDAEVSALLIEIDNEQEASQPLSFEDVSSWLRSVARSNFKDPETRKELVRVFVEKIYLYDDGRLELFFNYRGNHDSLDLRDFEDIIPPDDSGPGGYLESSVGSPNEHCANSDGFRFVIINNSIFLVRAFLPEY